MNGAAALPRALLFSAIAVASVPAPAGADCTSKGDADNDGQQDGANCEDFFGCESQGNGSDGCSNDTRVSSGMLIFGTVAFVSRRRRKSDGAAK